MHGDAHSLVAIERGEAVPALGLFLGLLGVT
jgi:hypothetical protein